MSLNDQETFNESNNSEYLNESNFSDYYERSGPTFFDSSVFTMILYCTLSLGVLGNFTTILYITCSKHLHTPTFITICSLAITDLTVVVISLFVKMYDNDRFFEGNVLFVALLVLYIAMINSSADVVFLFFLRFVLIVYPLKCRQYLTNSFVISTLLVLWGYSFFVVFVIFIIMNSVVPLIYEKTESTNLDTILLVLSIAVVPILVISVLHCFKMKTLQSSTANTSITRKMSAMIIIIATLNVLFGIGLNFLTTSPILFGLMSSFNPFIFFLFQVPYQKLCKNSNHNNRAIL